MLAHVQSTSVLSGGSGTTRACAFASNVGNSRLIIIVTAGTAPSLANVQGWTCADSLGTVYARATAGWDSGDSVGAATFYGITTSAGANTVTVTYNGTSGTDRTIAVHEYSGPAAASSVLVAYAETNSQFSILAETDQSQGDRIWGGKTFSMEFCWIACTGADPGVLSAGTGYQARVNNTSSTPGTSPSFLTYDKFHPTNRTYFGLPKFSAADTSADNLSACLVFASAESTFDTFPTCPVVDRFTGTGALGAGWGGVVNGTMIALTRSSGTVIPGAGQSGNYYTGVGPFADQDSFITISTLNSQGDYSDTLIGRVSTDHNNRIEFRVREDLTRVLFTRRLNGVDNFTIGPNGENSGLGEIAYEHGLAVGDKIGMRLVGNTYIGYMYDAIKDFWIELIRINDTTSPLLTAGYFGYYCTTTGAYDDYGAGNMIFPNASQTQQFASASGARW